MVVLGLSICPSLAFSESTELVKWVSAQSGSNFGAEQAAQLTSVN